MGSRFVKKLLERPTHEPFTYVGTSVITTLSHGCLIMSPFACKLPMKPHMSPHLQGQAQTQHQGIKRTMKMTLDDNTVLGWAQQSRPGWAGLNWVQAVWQDRDTVGTRQDRDTVGTWRDRDTSVPHPDCGEQTWFHSVPQAARVGSQLHFVWKMNTHTHIYKMYRTRIRCTVSWREDPGPRQPRYRYLRPAPAPH